MWKFHQLQEHQNANHVADGVVSAERLLCVRQELSGALRDSTCYRKVLPLRNRRSKRRPKKRQTDLEELHQGFPPLLGK